MFIFPTLYSAILIFLPGGGLFTLFVSFIGLTATSKRSPALLRFYALMLCTAFLVLMGGVVCSVRVVFIIHIGVNHALAVPLMKSYGKDPQSTASWDNLHSKFAFKHCEPKTLFMFDFSQLSLLWC